MEVISRKTLEQQGRIIHDVSVDIGNKRPVETPIHLVQYDNTLPVIAVKIYKDGNPFKLLDIYSAKLRWKDPKCGIRYQEVMGRSDPQEEGNFTTLYYTIDVNMTRYYGDINPILELSTNNMSSGSSPMTIIIHKNPIQEGDIEEEIKGVVLADVATSGSYNDLVDKPKIGLRTKIVENLPQIGEKEIIYLKLSSNPKEDNVYDEYMWLEKESGETKWEMIGSTKIFIELNAANGQHINEVGTPTVTKTKDSQGNITFTFDYLKGMQGIQGPQGIQGIQGIQGVSVSTITKTSTSGLVDTYTITYSDGRTTTFNVTNGEKGDTPSVKAASGQHINEVGTPTVTDSKDSQGNVTFTFDYLKGMQGVPGETGAKGDKGDPGVAFELLDNNILVITEN